MWAQAGQKFKELDAWVQSEAARRMEANRAAGIARNVKFVEGDTDGKFREQVIERITKGFRPPGSDAEQAIRARLASQRGRATVAKQYAPDMRRGLGGLTGRGAMEMINQGIAENALVRRGVLPAAVMGGGVLGAAGMTAGAQQLMALMSYLQGSQDTEARTEQPLTS